MSKKQAAKDFGISLSASLVTAALNEKSGAAEHIARMHALEELDEFGTPEYDMIAYEVLQCLDSATIEVLGQFIQGPKWCGDVVSKVGAYNLFDLGMAVSVIVDDEEGHYGTNSLGRRIFHAQPPKPKLGAANRLRNEE